MTIAAPANIRAPPSSIGIVILSPRMRAAKITALTGSIRPRMLALDAFTFFSPLKYSDTARMVGNIAKSIR
ncbi:Uncharacterised protein [uncultured archaeon]|nr:Uncharacterised protein [uncultured archaeon]